MNPISCKLPILIAEDDPDDRFLLKDALKAYEGVLEIYFVADGEELMEFLNSPAFPRPELILLDLRMPRKNGLEALVEIKQDDKLKQIPIVVWTTSDTENDKTFCLNAGAEGYATKPSNLADLKTAVKAILKDWLPLQSSVNYACDTVKACRIQPYISISTAGSSSSSAPVP